MVTRLLGHGVSVLAALVLSGVVAWHPKLWNQYYSLLVFSALDYALGCIFMILSDLEMVRTDRHINIAVSGT